MSGEIQKHPGGRPTKYHVSFCIQAEKMCRLGATDLQLADFFGVVESTIHKWKLEFPKFSESIKKGKDFPNQQVKRALYQRAIGYSHPDIHISNYLGLVTITDIVKHYPPDVAAAFIWLKNRDPENWRDKHEIAITNVTIGKPPELNDAEFPE